MHGRDFCLSLTLPAFSTIFLYKKASAARKPAGSAGTRTVEKKGKAAAHGAEKKTSARRVKAASEQAAPKKAAPRATRVKKN